MRQTALVRVAQCVEHLGGEPDGSVDGQHSLAAEHLPERLARNVWHDEPEQVIALARIDQRRDVRMMQLRGVANLAQKAIGGERDRELRSEERRVGEEGRSRWSPD